MGCEIITHINYRDYVTNITSPNGYITNITNPNGFISSIATCEDIITGEFLVYEDEYYFLHEDGAYLIFE
jgi:hypothetical protein